MASENKIYTGRRCPFWEGIVLSWVDIVYLGAHVRSVKTIPPELNGTNSTGNALVNDIEHEHSAINDIIK